MKYTVTVRHEPVWLEHIIIDAASANDAEQEALDRADVVDKPNTQAYGLEVANVEEI